MPQATRQRHRSLVLSPKAADTAILGTTAVSTWLTTITTAMATTTAGQCQRRASRTNSPLARALLLYLAMSRRGTIRGAPWTADAPARLILHLDTRPLLGLPEIKTFHRFFPLSRVTKQRNTPLSHSMTQKKYTHPANELRKALSAGPVSVSLALWFLFGLLLSAWFAFPMLRCFCVFRAFGEIKRDEMIPHGAKRNIPLFWSSYLFLCLFACTLVLCLDRCQVVTLIRESWG